MSDLIRRKDVVEALYQAIRTKLTGTFTDSMSLAIAMVNNLPSAEPERIAKVVEHDASITDTDGYKYHRFEYLCGACKKKVLGGDDYCSHCGAKLDWNYKE